ncbi:MAG: hypothetical protein VKO21_07175, partial [Candidatus Sericytochromatia bacterium]|nr:hypothetical protein [Candidatus Sericytochromatia bacterium]
MEQLKFVLSPRRPGEVPQMSSVPSFGSVGLSTSIPRKPDVEAGGAASAGAQAASTPRTSRDKTNVS